MWFIYAILAAILWGLNYSLAEKILQYISVYTLLSLEMFFGAILFFTLSFFTHLKTDLTILTNNTNLFWMTIFEIITVIIANYFIVISVQSKNATVAGIIELIYPLFIILFTWLLFREYHVNLSVILGGIFILIGVLIISFA